MITIAAMSVGKSLANATNGNDIPKEIAPRAVDILDPILRIRNAAKGVAATVPR